MQNKTVENSFNFAFSGQQYCSLFQKGYGGLPQFCWMAFQQHKIEHIEFFF